MKNRAQRSVIMVKVGVIWIPYNLVEKEGSILFTIPPPMFVSMIGNFCWCLLSMRRLCNDSVMERHLASSLQLYMHLIPTTKCTHDESKHIISIVLQVNWIQPQGLWSWKGKEIWVPQKIGWKRKNITHSCTHNTWSVIRHNIFCWYLWV